MSAISSASRSRDEMHLAGTPCRRSGSHRAARALARAPGLGALLSMAGCFFFSDGINQEPRAIVEVADQGPYYRGDAVSFSAAQSNDPDGEPVTVSWSAHPCNAGHTDCDDHDITGACDEAVHGNAQVKTLPVGAPFMLDAIPRQRQDGSTTQALVVVAEVIDPHGARHCDRSIIDVLNRAPVLVLQPQGFLAPRGNGYPIGAAVRVVAGGSDPDDDPVTYAWSYTPAAGSMPGAERWERVRDDIYELTADVIGTWNVKVTATDSLGASTTEEAEIYFQQDIPPCIGTTSPSAASGPYIVERGVPRLFSVLDVEDDLDVYPRPDTGEGSPLGSAAFRWLLSTPDTGETLVELPGHDDASYQLDPSHHAPGDELLLRVEIGDRVDRSLPCSDETDTCSLESNACMQRVTWSIQVR